LCSNIPVGAEDRYRPSRQYRLRIFYLTWKSRAHDVISLFDRVLCE
jgi:hypothetical protein